MNHPLVRLMLVAVVSSALLTSDRTLAQDASRAELRFVSTTKAATMEKELNKLAARGYRLERVFKGTLDGHLAAFVATNVKGSTTTRYEYKMLTTRRAATIEKEIMEAAAQGYEIRGLISTLRSGFDIMIGGETVALLERPFGESARRYDYKVLSSKLEKTIQEELDQAVSAGFTPTEVVLTEDAGGPSGLVGPQFVVTTILVRTANASDSSSVAGREYKFLEISKDGTMEREMNRAAKEGYRLYFCSYVLVALMYRDRGATGPAPYQYKLLATNKTETMQKELSEQSRLGYRYLATTSGLGVFTTVLERDLKPEGKESRHEYKLISASRQQKTQTDITEALAAGYQLLDLTTFGKFVAVLGRKSEEAPAKVNTTP